MYRPQTVATDSGFYIFLIVVIAIFALPLYKQFIRYLLKIIMRGGCFRA